MEKTALEIKQEKFKENPDNFVSLDDLIIGIMKTEKGYAHYIGNVSRIDLEIALSRIHFKIFEALKYLEIEAAASKKSDIIKPPSNGILKFAKGLK